MPFQMNRRRGRSQRSGIPARLLLAAGIAIFSLISYYSMGSKNPINGETQRVAISPEQEIALGVRAAPELTAQYGGLYRDRAAQRRVNAVGQRLVEAADRIIRAGGGENPFPFQFHLLADTRTVNAFALPGGQVFITAALYQRLETEGQLAGVLGHEIGHVLMRHGAQRLAQQKLTQGLIGAAGVGGGSRESAQVAAAVGKMINMKYGRDDELESDEWGVRLTVEAGYDPRAMLGLMRILDEAGGGRSTPEMMSTHPKPSNRQAYIRRLIQDAYPDGLPTGLRP